MEGMSVAIVLPQVFGVSAIALRRFLTLCNSAPPIVDPLSPMTLELQNAEFKCCCDAHHSLQTDTQYCRDPSHKTTDERENSPKIQISRAHRRWLNQHSDKIESQTARNPINAICEKSLSTDTTPGSTPSGDMGVNGGRRGFDSCRINRTPLRFESVTLPHRLHYRNMDTLKRMCLLPNFLSITLSNGQ
eukprot:Selendium_serpulae@DN3054_c0_g1_i1.p1